MYSYKTTKQPKKTFEIEVTFPKADIAKQYETAFDHLHKEFVFEGFRKGKVPKEIARKNMSRDDIYNHLIRDLFPKVYEEIITKDGIKPIISPQLELVSAKEGEDWVAKFKTAERPEIVLGNYKEKIKKVKLDSKKADIWVPGKDEQKNEQNAEQQRQMSTQAILASLMETVKLELSDLIIQEELNQRMSRLLDDIQKLGLTAEAYLKSKNITMEQLREQYFKEIEDTYKLEFILQEIADTEKITVEKEDLDKIFSHIKDEKERQAASQQAYYYATILRKQKTLDYLNSL